MKRYVLYVEFGLLMGVQLGWIVSGIMAVIR